MDVSLHVDVKAPPEIVWELLADPTQWPTFSDSFVKVKAHDDGALRLGAVYTVKQPSIRPLRWTVTALDPGRGFVWESTVAGVTTCGEHRVEQGPEGSQLHVRLVQRGVLARVVGAIGGAHYRALVHREVATFAGAAEHRAR